MKRASSPISATISALRPCGGAHRTVVHVVGEAVAVVGALHVQEHLGAVLGIRQADVGGGYEERFEAQPGAQPHGLAHVSGGAETLHQVAAVLRDVVRRPAPPRSPAWLRRPCRGATRPRNRHLSVAMARTIPAAPCRGRLPRTSDCGGRSTRRGACAPPRPPDSDLAIVFWAREAAPRIVASRVGRFFPGH